MRIFQRLNLLLLFLVFSEFLIPQPSYATKIKPPIGLAPYKCNPLLIQRKGGKITEKGPPGTIFDVFLTDEKGQRLPPNIFRGGGTAGPGGTVVINVPPGIKGACDADNETVVPKKKAFAVDDGSVGGAQAVLSIETIYCDPNLIPQNCELYNIFETIDFFLGANTSFSIPDLFADTNGDNQIDSGDVLYSLVDLSGYLVNPIPNFSLGDTFTVDNGQVSQFPFMFFSTTPFVFDQTTGFTGTPYSGQGTVLTQHDLEAEPIPEPSSTLGFLALGTLGIVSILNRQPNLSKSIQD
ncbi:MAG: PEP-CTERM sorting domain-containing protein [Microcystis sp. LE19-388.1G]|jgi:hypothetical protein|nr:PEP-CTERM sorting domain-containing protein [Microcystis sp. LE19-388.1G]